MSIRMLRLLAVFLLRGAGLFLIVVSAMNALERMTSLISQATIGGLPMSASILLGFLGPLIPALTGIFLAWRSRALARWLVPIRPNDCIGCGYPRRSASPRCPECGVVDPDGPRPQTG